MTLRKKGNKNNYIKKGTNKSKKKNKMVVIFSMMSLGTILIASYELKWLDVIIAICKLEFSNSKIEKISFKSRFYITKIHGEKEFFHAMSKRQLKYVDKFGKGYIFTDGQDEVPVIRTKHLNKYLLFEMIE